MFKFIVYFTVFVGCFNNAMLIEDLEVMFESKACIEASLVSLSPPKNNDNVGVILDSSVTFTTKEIEHVDKSATSKIHELAQYNEIQFLFKLVSEEGPPHDKSFTVSLLLGDEMYTGSGSSLKKAKQAAASSALLKTFYDHPPEKVKVEEDKTLTPTVALNNIATKLAIPVTYHLLNGKEEQVIDSYGSDDEPYGKSKSYFAKFNDTSNALRVPVEEAQTSGPFTVKVKVGDLVFKGFGHTIQGARHDAASKALKEMEREALLKNNVCSEEESYEECKQKKDSLKSPISRVHEFAQQHKLSVDFEIISETGKSHKKIFVTRCTLGDLVTEGEGASKKDSKRAAAEKMLEKMPKLETIYDENTIIGSSKKKNKKKNKKNKILRENNNDFVESISGMVSSIWSSSSSDNSDNGKKPKSISSDSVKDKLLQVGNNLNILVEFTDLRQFEGNFYSLLSLGVKPPHICLGKAIDREKSHNAAALNGFKFLHKLGILEKHTFIDSKLSDAFEEEELLVAEDGEIFFETSEKNG